GGGKTMPAMDEEARRHKQWRDGDTLKGYGCGMQRTSAGRPLEAENSQLYRVRVMRFAGKPHGASSWFSCRGAACCARHQANNGHPRAELAPPVHGVWGFRAY